MDRGQLTMGRVAYGTPLNQFPTPIATAAANLILRQILPVTYNPAR